MPLAADPRRDRDDKELAVIGRLAPGATLAQARGEMRDVARRLSEAQPASNGGWSVEARAVQRVDCLTADRDAVWVLFGAVGLLLLLACANVANLLVAQAATAAARSASARRSAPARRLMRQLFTESAVLALLGTAAAC